MALSVDVKLAVSKNGTEIGMRKDGDNDFGTLIPNYVGNSMTLITAAYSDGTDFIMKTDGQIDGETAITLASATSASTDLTWDAATSAYKGAVATMAVALTSHYDGILELKLGTTAAGGGGGTQQPAATTPPATGTTTQPTPPPPAIDNVDDAIEQAILDGASNDEIKTDLGVTGQQIGAVRRKRGL